MSEENLMQAMTCAYAQESGDLKGMGPRIENLHVGQRVPNYKKLCELLGEPVKSGTAKVAQIKRWEQRFSFERDKNAYIIKEIFNVPAISKDGRKRFSKYVEPLLLNYLWRAYEEYRLTEIEKSIPKWSVAIGLTSGRVYDEGIRNDWIQEYPFEMGFSPLVVQYISYELIQKCKEIMFSTVKSLEKRGVVQAEERMYIVKKMAHRRATQEEIRAVEKAKSRALGELGCNYFSMSMSRKKRRKYEAALNRIFCDEYGWSGAYMRLAIKLVRVQDGAVYQNININEMKNCIQKEIAQSIRENLKNEVRTGEMKDEAAWENGELGSSGYVLRPIEEAAMLFMLDELI